MARQAAFRLACSARASQCSRVPASNEADRDWGSGRISDADAVCDQLWVADAVNVSPKPGAACDSVAARSRCVRAIDSAQSELSSRVEREVERGLACKCHTRVEVESVCLSSRDSPVRFCRQLAVARDRRPDGRACEQPALRTVPTGRLEEARSLWRVRLRDRGPDGVSGVRGGGVMRRCVMLIALSILLGTCANILVAWGLVYTEYGLRVQPRVTEVHDRPGWLWSVPDSWPSSPATTRRSRWACLEWLTQNARGDGERDVRFTLQRVSHGWPLLSMCRFSGSIVDWGPPPEPGVLVSPNLIDVELPDAALADGIRIDLDASGANWRELPVVPLPLGFVVNTVLYGGVALILLLAIRWAWRRVVGVRRARRGTCASCGYQVGDLVACPECGAGVSGRTGRDGLEARPTEGV